jgi:predicted ATP-dependent endonuclease of OLD family
MITGLLFRHYKNYENVRFVPIVNDTKHMFSVYVGNNGVGKSAILEALDVALNNRRQWNVTQGSKKSESFICPVFLIPKNSVAASKRTDLEIASDFFWNVTQDDNQLVYGTQGIKELIEYRGSLKEEYQKTHLLILIGVSYDKPGTGFFASFDSAVKKLLGNDEEEQNARATALREQIYSLYSYLYIPVEESPTELLQLQNDTMQKLLNRDVLQEIETILGRNPGGDSIVKQINKRLDVFIDDVNTVISAIDSDYSFAPESGIKRSLTAKDIRAKVIEAYFPLRALKVNGRRVSLLSSGEQRRAIIDIAYSTLIANRERKTERNIILAIDEPEISMHISNCFNQFKRLEELSQKNVQVIVTTHWYGYLPIAQYGAMHYLAVPNDTTQITSFSLYNMTEERGKYPEDVDLKSMFDLASSLVSFMRREGQYKWIFCEGSDDKLYLQTMLRDYKDYFIIPLGGCGNVIKLYQILYGFVSEKSEEAKSQALFLIDTDVQRVQVKEPFQYSTAKSPLELKRLQIVRAAINLLDVIGSGTYEQTEMEDCLNPDIYYQAIAEAIKRSGDRSLKTAFKKYTFVPGSKRSRIRGDESCIRVTDVKFIDKKQLIVDFVEDDTNKYQIAEIYASLCEGKDVDHPLADQIAARLGLEKK